MSVTLRDGHMVSDDGGGMATDDGQKTAVYPAWSRRRWYLLAGVAALFLLLILAWFAFRPAADRPLDDLWQPATAGFDPDCAEDCRVVMRQGPSDHDPSSGVTLEIVTDPRLDDAVAQWGDCLDSVLSCAAVDADADTDARAVTLRACVARSQCPAACRERYAARSEGDLDAAAAAFEAIFLEEDAWCAPRL